MREWLWSSDTQWYVRLVLCERSSFLTWKILLPSCRCGAISLLHSVTSSLLVFIISVIYWFNCFLWLAALGRLAGAVCEVSWACWAIWSDGWGVQTGNSHLRTGERLSGKWIRASTMRNEQLKELAIVQKVSVIEFPSKRLLPTDCHLCSTIRFTFSLFRYSKQWCKADTT